MAIPDPRRSRTLRGLREDARLVRTWVARRDDGTRAAVADYLATHDVRKLQLGAGGKRRDGWLSTDIRPKHPGVVCLDATQPLPFPDASIDYILAEHLIEHVGYAQGQRMLGECLRVLRHGGVIRIATPDLDRLVAMYRGEAGPDGEHYIDWFYARFLRGRPHRSPVFVLNHAMRAWGHTFLYDESLLRTAITDAGFVDVARRDFGTSPHDHLRGVEQHGSHSRGNDRAVRFETMILEATKPA